MPTYIFFKNFEICVKNVYLTPYVGLKLKSGIQLLVGQVSHNCGRNHADPSYL